MKIKEVSEKTDLTERAIRLYIENGLVAPSVNESYSGRRNIDFSEADVERLRSISVMRKAGFSIAQIKLMQDFPERSKEILQEFITATRERIESDKEIISCLMPLLSVENLKPEQISKSLENPAVEEKLLPVEDSEPTAVQKFICKLFFALGTVGLILGVIFSIIILRVEVRDFKAYLYPTYNIDSALWLYSVLIGALASSVTVMLLNRKKSLRTRRRERVKAVISLVLAVVCCLLTFYNCLDASLTRFRKHPESYVISRTRDKANYMILDVAEASDVLIEFMPEEIPAVQNAKYYYYYKEIGVWSEPSSTKVSLELPLSRKDFISTVEYYRAFRPTDSVREPYEVKDGDWTFIYYRDNYEHPPTNYTPIFAFNENTCVIRLMCNYGRETMKGAVNGIGDFGYTW